MLASVRLTRRYAASPEEVWAALTDPDSVARWLGRGIPGEIRVAEPQRRLELAWRPDGERPSIVRFDLAADGDGTKLVLHHAPLDDRSCMRYGAAWTRAIGRLEEFVTQ
jgi:uncharacterized protein YndB with AHSA1/START domain